jgi:hypothetical protein
MTSRTPLVLSAVLVAASIAACGGGGSTNLPVAPRPGAPAPSGAPVSTPTPSGAPVSTPTPSGAPVSTPTPSGAPVSTPTPTASPLTVQVVAMAEPITAIGSIVDPTFGLVGGYTQQSTSQVLGFAPGSQIMIRNGQTATPHTFSVISTTGFTGAPTSLTAAGGSTIATGFTTGTVNGGALIGPFTLTAGTFFIGCAYHYTSENMRTVLVVAAGATPGPQATPPPAVTPPPPGSIY